MSGFTKIYPSLITSSVWSESLATKVVWITLLALADRNGVITSSIPGLARVAGVTVEEAEKAIEIFCSPDKYSTSKNHDGRRLEQVDSGWLLLNYMKFRDMNVTPERRNQVKEAVRKHRAKARKQDVILGNQGKHPEAEAEAEAKTPPNPQKGDVDRGAPSEDDSFLRFWSVYPKKVAKAQCAVRWRRLNPDAELTGRIIKDVQARLGTDQWQKSGGEFIPHPVTYINQRRWEDEVSTPSIDPDAGQPEILVRIASYEKKLGSHMGHPRYKIYHSGPEAINGTVVEEWKRMRKECDELIAQAQAEGHTVRRPIE